TLLRKAAAMPDCSFQRDHFASADLLLPELEQMKRSAGLLALDARFRARRGDARGALADVAAVFGMARHCTEPLLIVMVLACRLGAAALEDVLAHAAPKPDELARLELKEVSHRGSLRRCVQMEEAALGVPLMLSAVNSAEGESQWLREFMPPAARWFLDSPW